LLVRMNGAWDCFAQGFAWSATCAASAELLCVRCVVHGRYIFSREICFVSRRRCVGSRVFQRILESLNHCRRCVALPPSAASVEGTAEKHRLSKKCSACFIC